MHMNKNGNGLTSDDIFSESMGRRDGVSVAAGAVRIGIGVDRILIGR